MLYEAKNTQIFRKNQHASHSYLPLLLYVSMTVSSAKNRAAPLCLSVETTCKKLLNEREDRYFFP